MLSEIEPPYVQPLLLTVEQAAQSLQISRASIYPLLQRGEIQSIKIGRRRLIPPASLDAFVAKLMGDCQ